MYQSSESLRHSVATHLHNFRGYCVILACMAATLIILFITCFLHAPSGNLICGALTAGHLIAYSGVILLIALSPIFIKNAISEWQDFRQKNQELRLSVQL